MAALLRMAAVELGWVIPNVSAEIRRWRQRAVTIPDGPLREDALLTLERKRLAAEGAGLMATVAARSDRGVLELLVAYQVILDYLDTVSERPANDTRANGRRLHEALVEALDPGRPITDHYAHHPWRDDGGYLRALVSCCRERCAALPAYGRVAARLVDHANALAVQVANHEPDPPRRERELRRWARRGPQPSEPLRWFEHTASVSSTLAIHALLVAASNPDVTADELALTEAAYFPWLNAATTFLDSWVDLEIDAAAGDHSYIRYYPSLAVAAERLAEIVFESVNRARQLPRGHRHALIASGMVAMYLSHDAARTPELRDHTRAISRAAGSLQLVQLPIMRIFRRVHGLRDA